MTVENIDVSAALEKVKRLLIEEPDISPAFKASVELLMLVVSLLVNRLGRNSKNSSLPPSQDPHRKKESRTNEEKRKPGGQNGHKGTTLHKIANPQRIEKIAIDRRTIPRGTYTSAGYESRQVFDVKIDLCVTEYQAEILKDASGIQCVAPFPAGVTKAVQYGNEVKSQSVYMSQFQIHDHMKSYYLYKNCIQCLCNAHHLRELERAFTEDHQTWAKAMQDFLIELNKVVDAAGGVLSTEKQIEYEDRYRDILREGDVECLRPPPKEPGKRGRQKKSKSRNLLEQLINFEADTLRFMSVAIVPFTNNQAENDLRMTKVQQKISGCFRSMEGARIFCRIRSFLSTCRKNNVSPTEALRLLFQGKLPPFMN